jgi:Asp-tRNA(Asn)/Glu-tRNA(Gln) amidotransferase A subunit family amidase
MSGRASGADLPPLHGLPVAHKDVHETAGIRTTCGSPLRADYVPAELLDRHPGDLKDSLR